jgi:hypothetical protein
MGRNLMVIMLIGLGLGGLGAQELPSFGFDEEAAPASPSLQQRGSIQLDHFGFFAPSDLYDQRLESVLRARWELSASYQNAQGKLVLWLNSNELAQHPERLLNEAWVRYLAETWSLQAGLMKLVWGRADALRLLDVLTPLDRRLFVLETPLDQKIAQPMLRLSLNPTAYFQTEVVWTSWLEGDRLANTGPWVPLKLRNQINQAQGIFYSQYLNALQAQAYAAAYAQAMAQTNGNHALSASLASASVAGQLSLLQAQATQQTQGALERLFAFPEKLRWENSQVGVRTTLVTGLGDVGLQYWYGFLRLPSYNPDPSLVPLNNNQIVLWYDRVHHVGLDGAFNLAGFALRLETALDWTMDSKGDDPLMYNPSAGWNLGLDRDVEGLKFLAEVRQRFILFHDKITHPLDLEKDSDWLSTLVLLRLEQDLFQDTFGWKFSTLFSVEDTSVALLPEVIWKRNDFSVNLSGFFALGKDDRGLFSQFYENRLARLRVTYQF